MIFKCISTTSNIFLTFLVVGVVKISAPLKNNDKQIHLKHFRYKFYLFFIKKRTLEEIMDLK